MININNHFVEKRTLTPTEQSLVQILEDIEAHGFSGDYYGYWIEIIHLRELGTYLTLCNKNEKLLIRKKDSIRVRKSAENLYERILVLYNGIF